MPFTVLSRCSFDAGYRSRGFKGLAGPGATRWRRARDPCRRSERTRSRAASPSDGSERSTALSLRALADFSRRLVKKHRGCFLGRPRVAARGCVVVDDQARTPLPGHVHPHPLHEDADPEARLPQEFEMNGGPRQPGQKPAETQAAALEHGEALTDHGHGPFVEV